MADSSITTEVDSTEDIVRALLECLVDPLLPLKPTSVRGTPSLSQHESVAKQMHATVLLYNYYQRKYHPDLQFLDFESFCKLAVKLKPSLTLHMKSTHQLDPTMLDDHENQLSLTEKAIMNACSVSRMIIIKQIAYEKKGANLVLVARREYRLHGISENARRLGARNVLIMAANEWPVINRTMLSIKGRTNRPRNKKDPYTESRLPLLRLDFYVPRDEGFSHIKFSDFLAYAVKSISQIIAPEIKALFDKTPNEFDSFEDVSKWEMLRELFRSDGEKKFFMFPTPDVIKADKSSWRTDEEFGREMLAGVNPVVIRRL